MPEAVAEIIEEPQQTLDGGERSWIDGLEKAGMGDVPHPAEPAAQPAIPAPAPAAPAAASAEPEPDKLPRTAESWKKWKETRNKEREEWTAERTALGKQLEELQTKVKSAPAPGLADDMAALKKERDEISERLRIVDIQRQPAFQAKYSAKLSEQVEMAKRIVGAEVAEKVEKVLAMPEGEYKANAMEDLLDALTPLQQARLGSVINQLEIIENDRSNEIAQTAKDWDKIVAGNQERQNQVVSRREKAFEESVKSLQDSKNGSPIYQLKENNPAWNDAVQNRITAAKHLLFGGQATPEQVMQAALDAQAYPVMLGYAKSLGDENRKLSEQIKQLTGATPRLEPSSGGSSSAAPARTGAAPDEVSRVFLQAMRDAASATE